MEVAQVTDWTAYVWSQRPQPLNLKKVHRMNACISTTLSTAKHTRVYVEQRCTTCGCTGRMWPSIMKFPAVHV